MSLSEDLRNYLTERAEVIELVAANLIGSDDNMPEGWIFLGKPYKHVDTLSHQAILVISRGDPWDSPVRGMSLEFPRLEIDIWAAPSKDSTGDVSEYDADDLIEVIYKAIKPHIHTVHRNYEDGGRFTWGSEVDILEGGGSRIVSSEVIDGPSYRDITSGNGARMARISVGIQK